MGQPQTQKQKITRKIIFIGKDLNCYKNIKEKFQTIYPSELFDFIEVFEDEKNKVLGLIPKVLALSPHMIFVDYAIHRDLLLDLARFFINDISSKNILVSGLIENIDSKNMLIKSIGRGIFLNFIKGSEAINIVHHAMAIMCPEIARDVEFSLAKTDQELVTRTLFRLIFLNPKYIHFESSFAFLKGTTIKIYSDLKLNPDLSFNYIVSGEYDFDLCNYNFKKSYDFKYDHMDSTEIDYIASKIDEIEKKLEAHPKDSKLQYDLNERNTELMQALEKANEEAFNRPVVLNAWLEENKDKYIPHKTKVLIIDKTLDAFINPSEEIADLKFSFYLQSDFDDKTDIIHRLRPSIIVIGIETPMENKKASEGDNYVQRLQFVVTRIKAEKAYRPFLFVFNYKGSVEELKSKLGYPSLVLSNKPLELSSLKKASLLFESKQGGDLTHHGASDKQPGELRVYLDEADSRSNIYYQIPIQIVMLSETDIVFNCEVELPMYCCLQSKTPIEMTITVVPYKDKSKRSADDGKYYGLINGLGEVETNSLRKFVNDLIFEDEKS